MILPANLFLAWWGLGAVPFRYAVAQQLTSARQRERERILYGAELRCALPLENHSLAAHCFLESG